MNVTLTRQIEEQIRQWVERGHYPDADAVMQDALQALAEREQARFHKVRELVLAGFASEDAGELTPELMDEIEREAEAAFLRGEQPSRHVCP